MTQSILKNILKAKTVSVWGLGYLGYTVIFKLQNSGFNILAFDPNEEQAQLFMTGKYPNREQMAIWSALNYLPKVDPSRIKVATSPRELFGSSYLHVIAVPETRQSTAEQNVTSQLARTFSENLPKSGLAPLIVFQSAFVPGHIEKYFAQVLKRKDLACDRDYFLGVLFRTDWNVESFVTEKDKVPIAGYTPASLKAVREVVQFLSVPAVELDGIREAEIYVNALNAIQAMGSGFVRELAIGYPSVNVKHLSDALFKNFHFQDYGLNLGTGGEKMTFAIDHLIRGSENPNELALLKELQDINVSSVLSYGEYIIRHGYKSAAILGVSYKGDQKDLTLSPSITLADYLIKNSVRVILNDNLCTRAELQRLVKGARVVDFPDGVFDAEVLIVASDQKPYKFVSQEMLDSFKKKTRLVIDNHGIWSHLAFGENIQYHQVGDGRLNPLK